MKMWEPEMWVPDVSEHQGKINWDKLAGKIPAAIIRIGYGDDDKSQDDLYAAYNMSECRRLGIPFDVYIYSHADSDAHMKSEIAHMKRMCRGYSPCRYWLDVEIRKYKGYWKRAAELWKEAFGDRAGVYTWQWGFEQHVKTGLRWICAYGTNNGKRQDDYKPTIECALWQFTSKAVLSGIRGTVDLSESYVEFGDAQPIEIKPHRRVVTRKEVAALIMRHLCTHNAHGYTQDMEGRQGTGTETIDIYGVPYTIRSGDADCSSAVIRAYEAAGISCGGATYTGNMRERMVGTGNFIWRSMKFIAQMGDSYLNEDCHTAMCLSAEPDVLMEFSINEKGGTLGGKIGDQKQKGEYDETYGQGESHLKLYYDYPWDGILQCVGDGDKIAFVVEEDGSITYPDKDDGYTGGKDMVVVEPEKTDTDLAIEIIFGAYGKNPERQEALGVRYDPAQKEVNQFAPLNPQMIGAIKDYLKKHGTGKLI